MAERLPPFVLETSGALRCLKFGNSHFCRCININTEIFGIFAIPTRALPHSSCHIPRFFFASRMLLGIPTRHTRERFKPGSVGFRAKSWWFQVFTAPIARDQTWPMLMKLCLKWSFTLETTWHIAESGAPHLSTLIVPCLRLPAAFPRERRCHSCCSLRNAVPDNIVIGDEADPLTLLRVILKQHGLLWLNISQWIERLFTQGPPGYLHTSIPKTSWKMPTAGRQRNWRLAKQFSWGCCSCCPPQAPCLCCMQPVLSIGSCMKGIYPAFVP